MTDAFSEKFNEGRNGILAATGIGAALYGVEQLIQRAPTFQTIKETGLENLASGIAKMMPTPDLPLAISAPLALYGGYRGGFRGFLAATAAVTIPLVINSMDTAGKAAETVTNILTSQPESPQNLYELSTILTVGAVSYIIGAGLKGAKEISEGSRTLR